MTSPTSASLSTLLPSGKEEEPSSSTNAMAEDFFHADHNSSNDKDILSHQHQDLDLFLNQPYNLQTLPLQQQQQQQQQQPLPLVPIQAADLRDITTPVKQEATSSAPTPIKKSKIDNKKGKQKSKESGQKSLLQVFTNPLLHAIPILARNCLNFEDFIAQTQQSGQGLLGPEAFEDDNDNLCLISSPTIKSDTPWHLRVLGLPHTGAKSRVETQIKICLQVADSAGELALNKWTHIKLPEHLVSKDKLKKTQNAGSRLNNGTASGSNSTMQANQLQQQQQQLLNQEGVPAFIDSQVLTLEASVVCDGQPDTEVIMCLSCVHRECKRMKRKRDNKLARATNKAASASNAAAEGGSGNAASAAAAKIAALIATELPNLNDEKVMAEERKRILLFNCNEYVEFQSGEATLPTRITCYCRHHSEKTGFRIVFTLKDHLGHVIATGRSPPIMITDDHKSSKMQQLAAARKRSRADLENATASATESDGAATTNSRSGATKNRKLLDVQEVDSTVSSPLNSTPATPSSTILNDESTMAEGNSVGNSVQNATAVAKTASSDSEKDVQPDSTDKTQSTTRATNVSHSPTDFSMPDGSNTNSSNMFKMNMDMTTLTPQATTKMDTTALETFMASPPVGMSSSQFLSTQGQLYHQTAVDKNASNNDNDNMFLSQLQSHSEQPYIYGPAAPLTIDKAAANNDGMFDFLGTHDLNMLGHGNCPLPSQPPYGSLYQQQQHDPLQHQQQEQILSQFDRISNHQHNLIRARQKTLSSASNAANLSGDLVLASQSTQQQQQQQRQQQQSTNNIYAKLAERNALETKQAPHVPKLHRLIPSEGPIYGGAEVTVLGSNFYEGLTCLFGENPAIPTHCWSANTLLCILPPATTAGPVVVSFKEHPLMLEKGGQDVVLFTYYDESDRALMELALQVVGLKTLGKVEDARQIAMKIVQGGDSNGSHNNSNISISSSSGRNHAYSVSTAAKMTRMAMTAAYENARSFYLSKLEDNVIASLVAVQQHYQCLPHYLSLTNQYGHSLLHLATLCNYVELARLLVSKLNCNVNQVDKNGFTALHFATWTGNVELVRFLIDRTDVHITNNSGKTAEQLAMEGGHHSILKIFRNRKQHHEQRLKQSRRIKIPGTIKHCFLFPRLHVVQHYTSLLPRRLLKLLTSLYKLSQQRIESKRQLHCLLSSRTMRAKKTVADILSRNSNEPCYTHKIITQYAGRQVYHFVIDF